MAVDICSADCTASLCEAAIQTHEVVRCLADFTFALAVCAHEVEFRLEVSDSRGDVLYFAEDVAKSIDSVAKGDGDKVGAGFEGKTVEEVVVDCTSC